MAVVIETTLGDITVDLYLEQRPVTCLNFLKLCKMKYYNFNLFHTIRSGFIAQTGDPTGEGSGGESIFGLLEGPEKRFFSGEKMPKIRHTNTGLLSMVGTGDMMVGSQFFLTLGTDLDSLDGVHCVIGEVTEGHEVLRKLNEAICDETHRPYQDVRITHTVVLEDPFNDPAGLRAPSRSPSPCSERLKGGRIAPDEELDETQGKSAAEIQEIIEEKEAKARATILEIVGDLPDADIAPPENVLFVCKLNPVTSDEDLEIIFSRFGKIESCEVIRDKKTGESLQYAFIEFADKKSCEDAYFKMDNVLIDDRRIHVDFSQSVSKMRWLGKGRGVQHFDDDSAKDNSFKSKPHRDFEERSRNRNNNQQDDRGSNSRRKNCEADKGFERNYKNDHRERSNSRERYRENKKLKLNHERQNKTDDVRKDRNRRERDSSNEKSLYKNDSDDKKSNSKYVRHEKRHRERSRSLEKRAEIRHKTQDKEEENKKLAQTDEKRKKERKLESRSRDDEVRKVRHSPTHDENRKKLNEKEKEQKSKPSDVSLKKSRKERSISRERYDKERRQEDCKRHERTSRSDIAPKENSLTRESSDANRYTDRVHRSRDEKYNHHENRSKSDHNNALSKSTSKIRDSSIDKEKTAHINNDISKQLRKCDRKRDKSDEDVTQHKGKKRHLAESKHSKSNKKHKKGTKDTGEPLTPSPVERKQKAKSHNNEKGKGSLKRDKSGMKKRKESTSSYSSSSESSTTTTDSSSSSESDDRNKRSRRKRKYSSSSSSDTTDSSTSSSSSSDSTTSDTSSSSSGSEKNKRRKKNNKTKPVKKHSKK